MRHWDWKNLYNKKLNSLYSSLNIIMVIISRRMGLVEHVVLAYKILVIILEGKIQFCRCKCR
jgi:hypothetical protein